MRQTIHKPPSNSATSLSPKLSVRLAVNGIERQLSVRPWTTLLDTLRDHLDLTGTKKGCDHGQCGACTVLVDGRRVVSCLTLAVMKDGAEITTIEGLAQRWRAPPVATGLHRARRLSMRLLHARADLLGRRPNGRRKSKDRRRYSRIDERKHLSLRLLSKHRCCHRGGHAGNPIRNRRHDRFRLYACPRRQRRGSPDRGAIPPPDSSPAAPISSI